MTESETTFLLLGGVLGSGVGYRVGVWVAVFRATRASSRTIRGRR